MDDDEQKYPSQLAERFQVRLPIGLRDRIKAYAEQKGRSMNTEIVRILEREFPEPWPIETRVADLIEMLAVLKGGATDERIDKLTGEIEETVLGMMTGRVQGVADRALKNIGRLWEQYQEQRLENARDRA
ncbi:MAG: Arc family DNA-binding protein, partial [Mesorhizobium sp.]